MERRDFGGFVNGNDAVPNGNSDSGEGESSREPPSYNNGHVSTDEDDDIIFLGEFEPEEPTEDAVEILDYLAIENNVHIDYSITELDGGVMSLPTYYKCILNAGAFHVEAESPYKRIAKLLAAELCLDEMQQYHPDVRLPRWKKCTPPDTNLDPVCLLHQYCSGFQLPLPCYSYTCKKGETGEVEHIYNYYWQNANMEGRNSSKAMAKRLAALGMLDHIITTGVESMKPSFSVDHVSLDPATAAKVLEDQQDLSQIAPKSFEVNVQGGNRPLDPKIKVRYGISLDAAKDKERYRFYTEYEATITARGADEQEALQTCLTEALASAQKLRDNTHRNVPSTSQERV